MIKNLIGSALLALGAELVLKRNCEWNERWESRPKRRDLELIVFFERECVKDIREFLLRARSAAKASRRFWMRSGWCSTLSAAQGEI
jgi:hypothetical protein